MHDFCLVLAKCKHPLNKRRSNGFTLIEILVALSIFSIVMVLITTGFRTVLNLRSRLKNQIDQFHQLQLALLLVERDFTQVIQTEERISSSRPPLSSNGINAIQFIRGGMINPLGRSKRSTLQKVSYKLVDQTLVRTSSEFMEGMNTPFYTFSMPILKGVERLEFQFWSHNKKWSNQWPNPISTEKKRLNNILLPSAIKVILEVKGGNKIVRVLLIPRRDYYGST